jgi:hypothetical protein
MTKAYPWIVIAVLVAVIGSTLALMNNACKTSPHAWCDPESRHQLSRTARLRL